jgi:hypothetical protein
LTIPRKYITTRRRPSHPAPSSAPVPTRDVPPPCDA